jgi:lipoic acid synthetase
VIGHNVETVRRLTPDLRDRRAGYERTLDVLAYLSECASAPTKSGLMVGLGESRAEIDATLGDLRDCGVRIVTVGQYLRPSERSAPVERYVAPEEFDEIAASASRMGFASVVAGPLVRSSYRALEAYVASCGC